MPKLRILIVSTVYNCTPPIGYGGIQRVVHWLTEALVRQGHAVTLVAPPGSWCSGRTVHVDAYDPQRKWTAVRGMQDLLSEEPLYECLSDLLAREAFDVLHDWSFQNLFIRRHPERMPFVVSSCIPGTRDTSAPNTVGCSAAHGDQLGGKPFVHYGLLLDDWAARHQKSQPPIHIAKVARFKGQHLAVLAAMRAGSALTLAGNVESERYFRWGLRPLMALAPGVRYVGELKDTPEPLRAAAALVQTPRWFDCFPLVALEALASATPVLSFRAGGTSEQVKHGETGFLCDGVSDLAQALRQLPHINPAACRADAEQRFTDRRMALDYVALYERALNQERW